MDIAPLINRVARGKHGAQHLNQKEARTVFSELLNPAADPLQLGAFLIAQRMKGESSAEIAGFVEAVRAGIPGMGDFSAPQGAVDLPCYAGKRRASPAHLLAALRARDTGVPIVVHGVANIEGRVTAWQFLKVAGIKRAVTLGEAAAIVADQGMVYIDLAELSPELTRIYNLRPRLGVRSFANTVARLLNPLDCTGQLNGFFHTPYGQLMGEANSMLGQPRSLLFMGAEGEAELYADRQKVMVCQQGASINQLGYADAGVLPYPKAVKEEAAILADSAQLLNGHLSDREAAVMMRMQQAFSWASTAEIPEDWHREEMK